MRILLTCANGQLGKELFKHLQGKDVLAVDILEMDITDQNKTYRVINGHQPDVAINTAAYTNVDEVEADWEKAYRVNAVGTQNVAGACLYCGAKMLISI